jgi:hypothetical protein
MDEQGSLSPLLCSSKAAQPSNGPTEASGPKNRAAGGF